MLLHHSQWGAIWSFVSCCRIESRVKVLSFLKFTQQQTNKTNKTKQTKGNKQELQVDGNNKQANKQKQNKQTIGNKQELQVDGCFLFYARDNACGRGLYQSKV
jgi:hypothetical protein